MRLPGAGLVGSPFGSPFGSAPRVAPGAGGGSAGPTGNMSPACASNGDALQAESSLTGTSAASPHRGFEQMYSAGASQGGLACKELQAKNIFFGQRCPVPHYSCQRLPFHFDVCMQIVLLSGCTMTAHVKALRSGYEYTLKPLFRLYTRMP